MTFSRNPLHRSSIIIGLNKRHKSPILISKDIIRLGSSDCPCNWPCNRSCSQINTNINCLPLSKTSALSLAGWIFIAGISWPTVKANYISLIIKTAYSCLALLGINDTYTDINTWICNLNNFYLEIEDLIIRDYFVVDVMLIAIKAFRENKICENAVYLRFLLFQDS